MLKPDLRMFFPKSVPFWMVSTAVVLGIASLVPIALVLRYSQLYHEKPAVHLFLDMDNQPKLKAQHASSVFADGRAMRPAVPGAVARGHLDTDDHYHRGFRPIISAEGQSSVEYISGYPADVKVDAVFVQRGREIYESKCYPCHGKAGYGDGPVNKRAMELATTGNQDLKLGTVWATAQNLQKIDENSGQLTYGPGVYAEGKMFNVITHGLGSMQGYGEKITVKDRWAVVAYIRALQLSQHPDLMQAALSDDASANPAVTLAQ